MAPKQEHMLHARTHNRRRSHSASHTSSPQQLPQNRYPHYLVDGPIMSGFYLPPLDTSRGQQQSLSQNKRHQVSRSISEFSAFPKLHRPHHHHHHHGHGSHKKDKDEELTQSAGPNLQLNGENVGTTSDNGTLNESRDASRRTSVWGSGWEDGEKERAKMIVKEGQVAEEKELGIQRATWVLI